MNVRSTRAKRKNTTETEAFSFASVVPRYADKSSYVANAVVFTIIAIEYQEKRGYNGADRWALTVALRDGKLFEIITLSANEGRNAQLQAAKEHIAANGPTSNLRLVRAGSAYYLRPAESAGT